jgi:hypothetical protein
MKKRKWRFLFWILDSEFWIGSFRSAAQCPAFEIVGGAQCVQSKIGSQKSGIKNWESKVESYRGWEK